MTPEQRDRIRETPPEDRRHLWTWLRNFTQFEIADAQVCRAHRPPLEAVADQWLNRPAISVTLGPRGGGKSFDAALLTHLTSRFLPFHGTQILGGSKAQSEQIYRGLTEAVVRGSGCLGSDVGAIRSLLKESAHYRNGSTVSILAASSRQVRGPHVPVLRLDEVDEIDDQIRQDALGMVMADRRRGYPAQVAMTSTWHRLDGPMAKLIERGRGGDFPLYSYCSFDVLEACPESRSGPWVGGEAGYAECPACPLKPWCHAERDRNGGIPLAKLSDGHYAIGSLIQKIQTVSLRVFEADYLCRGPKADGAWFPSFHRDTHVSPEAEYDPALPVHLSIDSGVVTGAVWFQVARGGAAGTERVTVFADYLAEGVGAESNARAILEVGRQRCNGRADVTSTDPSGGARNPVGPSVIAEFERAGLRNLRRWPIGSVSDALSLVDSFVKAADGTVGLKVHPRCEATIRALESYRRAKRQGQWQDYPEDPQHSAEDLVDALKGGLRVAFPEGRKGPSPLRRVPGRSVF